MLFPALSRHHGAVARRSPQEFNMGLTDANNKSRQGADESASPATVSGTQRIEGADTAEGPFCKANISVDRLCID